MTATWRRHQAPAMSRPTPARVESLAAEVTSQARCQQSPIDPEWFVPSGSKATVVEGHQRAVLACSTCPVVDQCLEMAAGNAERSGVWGGVVLANQMTALEAWARHTAGQPIRNEMLGDALRAAARRNIDGQAGGLTRRDREAAIQQEMQTLAAAVMADDLQPQHGRDAVTFGELVRADAAAGFDEFAEFGEREAAVTETVAAALSGEWSFESSDGEVLGEPAGLAELAQSAA